MSQLYIEAADLRDLKQIQPARFNSALLGDYLVIIACLLAGSLVMSSAPMLWVLLPLIWIVVASRQHAILILMHEATHSLGFRDRSLNDFVGELLCSAPFFITMRNYRRNHLAHHKWCNTERDPDWVRKFENPEVRAGWTFPITHTGIRFWINFWIESIKYQFGTVASISVESNNSKGKSLPLSRLILYVVTIAALTFFGWWEEFLLLWIVPFVAVLPFLLRLRSIAEHFGLEYRNELSETRNVLFRNVFERFIFAPHSVSLHLAHHLHADVPFYSLGRLHAMLMKNPVYAQQAHNNDGYFLGNNPVFRDLTAISPERHLWNVEALSLP